LLYERQGTHVPQVSVERGSVRHDIGQIEVAGGALLKRGVRQELNRTMNLSIALPADELTDRRLERQHALEQIPKGSALNLSVTVQRDTT
jgi:hypothetical protein